ncbi:SGM_3592 family protein [Streptomyces collinus]|uniref:SGM_3592 family protein n=1 Tax=Streptomyces collinus TaxID=42684 RepID=UPI0037D8096C
MAGERAQYDDGGQSIGGQGSGAGPGSRGEAPDDLDGVVLDEDFIRSAGTSEPSARARMLAAKWRRDEPEPQPWRSDEPPAGWFFSKSRRRRWRRK